MEKINWPDFEKVELRVGTITEAEEFPEAHIPAYKITADFGPEFGIKKSSARITDLYTKEELVGMQIIGVVNFPPKKIGPFTSEFLVTGFYDQNGAVILAVPDKPAPDGSKLA
jgi:tRNA-binding protein